MKHISIYLGIFLAIAIRRFIPHPPNFTSLIALSFYVPAILGLAYIPALILRFAVTDIVIGYHTRTFFTWGSVFLIGLTAQAFSRTLISRLSGALLCAFIFFLISNFGVWVSGRYGYTLNGFIDCYLLAIPFLYLFFFIFYKFFYEQNIYKKKLLLFLIFFGCWYFLE